MWVVIWLAVTLASLLALLTVILSIPFEIRSRIEVYENLKFKLRFILFFGLLKKDIKAKKKPPKKKEKEKPGEGRKWLWAAYRIIRINGMLNNVKRLVKGIFHSFRIRSLRVNLKVALDDPADTAFIAGIINVVRLFWKPSFPHEIDIRPDFEGNVILEGYTQIIVRVLPILIVASLLRFLFSWSMLQAMKILVVTKWKK